MKMSVPDSPLVNLNGLIFFENQAVWALFPTNSQTMAQKLDKDGEERGSTRHCIGHT